MWIFVVFWQEEEETELAVICLQKLLRGRAIQNMVFCVSLFMSVQNDGGNGWKCVCNLSSTAPIKGNEASAAYPPICYLESFKAEVFVLQPKFLTGPSRFLHMSVSVSLFLPSPTLSCLIRRFIAELLKWQILD